jgi:hypothetical protein
VYCEGGLTEGTKPRGDGPILPSKELVRTLAPGEQKDRRNREIPDYCANPITGEDGSWTDGNSTFLGVVGGTGVKWT